MMLHLRHAAKQGHTKAYLRTVDSDVVVLAINLFQELGLSELWIGFRSGNAYEDSIHHISEGGISKMPNTASLLRVHRM